MCEIIVEEHSPIFYETENFNSRPKSKQCCCKCAERRLPQNPAKIIPIATISLCVPPPPFEQHKKASGKPESCRTMIKDIEKELPNYSNFYNGYNIQYRPDKNLNRTRIYDNCDDRPGRKIGQTVDGKSTCCPRCQRLVSIKTVPDEMMNAYDCCGRIR